MSTLVIPEGLEPLAAWDGIRISEYGFSRETIERAEWARERLGDPAFIYRAEFYLLDGPFAVVHCYARGADGFKYQDAETGSIAVEPPAIVPLGELPPAHLLR